MSLGRIGREIGGTGLDGLCLTDHQVMAGDEVLSVLPDGFTFLVGMEYSTSQGDFLLFGLDKPPIDGMEAPDILRMVHDMGGASVAAHPCRAGRPLDPALLHSGLIHAVEVLNGRCTPQENSAALDLAKAFGLPRTGGSDAHTPPEIGRFATLVGQPVRSAEQLARIIRQGGVSPISLSESQTANLVAASA